MYDIIFLLADGKDSLAVQLELQSLWKKKMSGLSLSSLWCTFVLTTWRRNMVEQSVSSCFQKSKTKFPTKKRKLHNVQQVCCINPADFGQIGCPSHVHCQSQSSSCSQSHSSHSIPHWPSVARARSPSRSYLCQEFLSATFGSWLVNSTTFAYLLAGDTS